jgi:hypothetical protein
MQSVITAESHVNKVVEGLQDAPLLKSQLDIITDTDEGSSTSTSDSEESADSINEDVLEKFEELDHTIEKTQESIKELKAQFAKELTQV